MSTEIKPNQYANFNPHTLCRMFQKSYDRIDSESIREERALMIKSLADSTAKLVIKAPVEEHRDYLETISAMLISGPVPLRDDIKSRLYLEIALSLAAQTQSE